MLPNNTNWKFGRQKRAVYLATRPQDALPLMRPAARFYVGKIIILVIKTPHFFCITILFNYYFVISDK